MINFEPKFEDFWIVYDKKVNRRKSEKLWDKLKFQDKQAIMETLPLYLASTPNKQYRKNPTTYLNNDAWEDEIIITKELINGLNTESRQSAVLDTSY